MNKNNTEKNNSEKEFYKEMKQAILQLQIKINCDEYNPEDIKILFKIGEKYDPKLYATFLSVFEGYIKQYSTKPKGDSSLHFVFEKNQKSIFKPPGSTFLNFANFLYSKKTYKKIFEPIISDMREEYFEALQDNRKWKARYIKIIYSISFIQTMIAHAGISVFKLAKDIWKISQ